MKKRTKRRGIVSVELALLTAIAIVPMAVGAFQVSNLVFARHQTFAACSHARAVSQSNGLHEAGLLAVEGEGGVLTTWEGGRFTSSKTVRFLGMDKTVQSSLAWSE
jgi:hypothetical protein